MPLPGAWPLLAFIVVPGAFAWWSGRRLAREPADAAVAERLLARAQHTQRATLLSCLCLVFGAGPYYWVAVAGLIVGLWIGDYPCRRVLLDERWGLAGYVLWQARFNVALLGFWFTLLAAPFVIEGAGAWRWPAAAVLALLLGGWASHYTEVFLWLVGARARLMRPEWQTIVERSRAPRPRVFEMPVPGGRVVNAFALPARATPHVIFTAPALELLSPREQAAVFAHEVAHLEHHDARRCRLASVVTYALVALGTLGAALALERLPGALISSVWSFGLIAAFLCRGARQKAHETASDVRALALCQDPEALVSGLTKLTIAGRMPRRWSTELEHGASHPSLARRLYAIRRVSAISVMPLDDTRVVATTRPAALVILDRDGVSWVDARDPAERDPDILRATARSRWSVPYDELVELRVRAFWWSGASLVARDRSGTSRAVSIPPGEVEALQRKLDAVEHRLAHDAVAPEPPAPLMRFTALGVGIVALFVNGVLVLGVLAALATLLRPSRAALAAVAGAAAACLLVIALDVGVRQPTWPILAYAIAAGLVCAMAVWLAMQPRTFPPRPLDYLPVAGVLLVVVVLTWGPLVAHLWHTSRRAAVAVHLLGGAPILWASLLVLGAVLLTTPYRRVRRAGVVVITVGLVLGPGVRVADTRLASRPIAVGETTRGDIGRAAQLELPWRIGTLRVSPAGSRAAILTREAARAPDRFLVLGLAGERAETDGRDLHFVDESNALTLIESANRTVLQHIELAESSATPGWSIALPALNSPTVSAVRASGWAVVGYDEDAEEFVGLVGRIGSPGVNRYRWHVDDSESLGSEVVEILPDGRGFRAVTGATPLARVPWGAWIYDRSPRRQTRVWRLNGNAQELVAVWPTAAVCQLVAHSAADVVCLGERHEQTLIWRFALEARPTRPLSVLEVGRRSGVSPDGRFVALWGKDALVVVDLDRGTATRRPLPADVGVPVEIVPLADRVVAVFRRARSAPMLHVFDARVRTAVVHSAP